MGITGTDVAKGASDMTLTDDNFATIVDAVKEGRGIYDNIRKCVKYLLSSNIGEVLTIFVASLLGVFGVLTSGDATPLAAMHLLWINLITDSLPAFGIGMEEAEDEIMLEKPRPKHEGFFATLTDFKSVYKANMSLLEYKNAKQLFDEKWPIYTRTSDTCPTQYFEEAEVKASVVSNGCLIQGSIENSVVGRGCTIGKDCVIKNCVISSDVVIADGTHLENLIVDKHASVLHTKEIVADPENPGYVKRGDII
jgi:hypothetical protein